MMHLIDPARCPLCDAPNDCRMASSDADNDSPCWCAHVRFPAPLLDRVPPDAKHKACICRACADAANDEG